MNKGFFQLIVIFLLIIVIMSLLGVSLSKLTENPALKENLSFLWNWISFILKDFLILIGSIKK